MAKVIISKPKLFGLILALILIFLNVPFAMALTYTATLPSDTILFEDFQGTTNTWHSVDTCTGGKAASNTTYAFPGLSKSFLLLCPTASQIQDAHWAFAARDTTTLIKFSVLFFPTQQMNTTLFSGDISFSNEAWDASNHFEGKIIYNARTCLWTLYYGQLGSPTTTLTVTLADVCIPTELQTSTPNTPHISQSWSYVSMTVDWSTSPGGIYSQICIVRHCYSAAEIASKTVGGSLLVRDISAAGVGFTPEAFHSIELSRDTGTVGASGNYGAHFANLLVEDLTGQACGPLCLSTFNFGLALTSMMMVSGSVIGFVYTEKFMGKGEPDSKHIQSANRWLKDAIRGLMFIFLGIGVIAGMSVIFGQG